MTTLCSLYLVCAVLLDCLGGWQSRLFRESIAGQAIQIQIQIQISILTTLLPITSRFPSKFKMNEITTSNGFDQAVSVFANVQKAMSYCDHFPVILFKPQQIQCWSHLLDGRDVIAVLPTGFGKSTIFQLLPFILPAHNEKEKNGEGDEKEKEEETGTNIVLVIGPLNSIMADQMKFLTDVGIPCGSVGFSDHDTALPSNKLFPQKLFADAGDGDNNNEEDDIDFSLETMVLHDSVVNPEDGISTNIIEGKCSVVFGHPEGFLSPSGRKLLNSDLYQKKVVAITIDEAHCIETW